MIPVAVATAAGWLLLFFVLLALPPASQPTPEEGVTPGTEPPAAVSLLAKRLDRDGFGATLADLAARGWFRLSGAPGPAGPVMCVLPAETPAEPLAPYERRVMAHVARRAGTRTEVPAPALSDGFEGGKEAFMKAFRDEVTADAERRGLRQPRLSGRRIGLLCLALFVPAGASTVALAAAHQRYPLAWAAVSWFVAAMATIGVGASRRTSAAGRAVLERWHAAADEWRRGGVTGGAYPGGGTGAGGGDARLQAYAAALGRAPGAVAAFDHTGQNVVWSSYRGGWQQLPVETRGGSWPLAVGAMLAIIFGPFALIGGVAWLFAAGLGWLGERVIVLVLAAVVVGVAIWVVRRLTPRFAEFDGQVIRQTFWEHDEGPDEYKVVVDDGVSATAWDLSIPADAWRQMPPGTFVHARVNLHNREQVDIHPVEPPAVARSLAGLAAEQERAAAPLPDPGVLVTADDAAWVLHCAVRGKNAGSQDSRAIIWQPAGAERPMLRVEVRRVEVRRAGPPGGRPQVPPGARPVPGVAGGYLAGPSAVLDGGSCVVTVSIHGTGAEEEALLPNLLSLVAMRLPRLASWHE